MDWTISILFLVIGAMIGFFISQLKTKNQDNQGTTQAQLHQAQTELAQYRQDMADHFADSATLMNQMANDYNKIYRHMLQSQQTLLPDTHPQQAGFMAELATATDDVGAVIHAGNIEDHSNQNQSEPPNDYARGSHGIINPVPRDSSSQAIG